MDEKRDKMIYLVCEVCDGPMSREYSICLDCEKELRAALTDTEIARVLRGPDEQVTTLEEQQK